MNWLKQLWSVIRCLLRHDNRKMVNTSYSGEYLSWCPICGVGVKVRR